jgi:hypothetical protein
VDLLQTPSDTDPCTVHIVGGVAPYRDTSSAPPVDDLSALVEGADLAALRLLGGVRSATGSPDAPLVSSCSGFGETAAGTCTAIACERCDP